MNPTRISVFLIPAILATGLATGSPGVWQGSFAFSGGDPESRVREEALGRMRGSDQEKLPFGAAVPASFDFAVEGGTLTIRTDAGTFSGPFDGTVFDARSAAGADARVTRTLVEEAGKPITIVETWKVPQPRQGRSMVKAVVQETSYALSADGSTLTLTVKIEGGRLREPATYTLTYRKR